MELYFLGDDRYDVKLLKDGNYRIPDFLFAQYTLAELKVAFNFSDFRSYYPQEVDISFFETEYKCSTISEFLENEKEQETICNIKLIFHTISFIF